MIRNILQYSSICLLILVFTNCSIKYQTSLTVKPNQPTLSEQNKIISPLKSFPLQEKVPQPPILGNINSSTHIKSLVIDMLESTNIPPKSILLVDELKNNTNGSLKVDKIQSMIDSALLDNKKFVLVSQNQLKNTKQRLGLSLNDNLKTHSKMIGLARIIKAQYILYSNASGNVKYPIIQMQLVSVNTGEIIWSGNIML